MLSLAATTCCSIYLLFWREWCTCCRYIDACEFVSCVALIILMPTLDLFPEMPHLAFAFTNAHLKSTQG
jgi:hypothetical protein